MPIHSPYVLIIDDDEINNFITAKLISKIPHTPKVTTCLNGEIGLNFLSNCIKTNATLPDIIFLDINMPVTNGWEFLDRYEKIISPFLSHAIPINMVTSSVYTNDISKAKSYNFVNKFVSKPLNIEKITELFGQIKG
jgi:CheY-like chemotaxis protein